MDYKIRFATLDDHDLIYALKSESVRPYVERIWGWDEDYQWKDFDADFSHIKQFNVIEVDGKFAGFVQYYFEYPYFEVVEIHLLPEYRSKGIGSDILRYLQKVCVAQDRKIRIGCFKENHRAKSLYQKLGFMQTEETDTHYILEYPNSRVLESKDLILRRGSADDWQDLYRNLWSHTEVFRYMFKNPCPSEEHAAARTGAYAVMHEEVKTEFFACEKASGQVIGIAGIKELKPGKWTVTDIAIGPDFWGKGYGKQIVTALLKLAFELGATEVAYDCFTQNIASKQLALSCGFIYSHSEEAELKKNGEKVILDYYIHQRK